jgi:hypothetical protein
MTTTQQFEMACQQIKNRDGIKALHYRLQGPHHDPAVLLNTKFMNIAKKHLYFEQKGKPNHTYIFSWQQITDACKLADIFVTDVVRKNL